MRTQVKSTTLKGLNLLNLVTFWRSKSLVCADAANKLDQRYKEKPRLDKKVRYIM